MFFPSEDAILNHEKIKKFTKIYIGEDNWHNIDTKKHNLGYGFIHYSIIRATKPKKILCVGSKLGFIPAICALACKDNQYGEVSFVDANFDSSNKENTKNHWGGVGQWTKKNAKKHFAKFSLEGYITMHTMLTKDFHQKNLHADWDYIYLDGDHSYKGVKADFKMFWPQLNKKGYLLLHDIYANEKKNKKLGNFNYGVHKLWKELKKISSSAISFEGEYGLGIIQKN